MPGFVVPSSVSLSLLQSFLFHSFLSCFPSPSTLFSLLLSPLIHTHTHRTYIPALLVFIDTNGTLWRPVSRGPHYESETLLSLSSFSLFATFYTRHAITPVPLPSFESRQLVRDLFLLSTSSLVRSGWGTRRKRVFYLCFQFVGPPTPGWHRESRPRRWDWITPRITILGDDCRLDTGGSVTFGDNFQFFVRGAVTVTVNGHKHKICIGSINIHHKFNTILASTLRQ